jgi:plastocyanin
MPTTQLQFRRGNTAQTSVFTGAIGEVTVDTDRKTLTVHDGVTVGGTYVATNIQLTSAFSKANAANVLAQAAFNAANTANVALVQASFDKANVANTTAEAGFARANAANNLAQSAYNQAISTYLPSTTRLEVTNNGSSAYLFDQYTENNATLYVTAGETIAFNLNVTGHPFLIRVSSLGTLYNIGLTHVTTTAAVATNSSAQGQIAGTLYWKVPSVLAGNTYVYQCQNHSGMVGNVVIQSAGYISLIQLKSTVANSANYAAFQSAIASL